MKYIARILAVGAAFLFPALAYAVTAGSAPAQPVSSLGTTGLEGVLGTVGKLVGVITPLIVALALLAFFWGLAMYILNFQGEDKDKKKGRDVMMYGIITLFVMVSVWGLVGVLQVTFFKNGELSTSPNVPYIIPPSGH